MNLEKKIVAYLQVHRRKPSTHETYLLRYKQFCEHLRRLEVPSSEYATIEQVYEFLSILKEVSPSSAQQARATLDIVFNKILKKNYPVTSFKLDYREKTIKSYLTENEIYSLLSKTQNLKLRCAIGLMYSARLSVGEAVDLRTTDIDFANKIITVRSTKNSRLTRRVALSDYIAEDLKEHLAKPRNTSFVFESKSGETKNSTDWLQRGFKRALLSAGITKQVSTNVLLDSYVIHLQAQGVLLYHILKAQKLSVGSNLLIYSELQPPPKYIPNPLDAIMQGTYEDLSEKKNREPYISLSRIRELEKCKSNKYDLRKLIQLCKEINIAHSKDSFFTIGMLIRAIIDHVPPIFDKLEFSEVANNYSGGRSFSESMKPLDKFLRVIADGYLHSRIRDKETLPTFKQVEFHSQLDALLAEVVRKLKE